MKMYEKILCVNVEFSDEIKLTNECKIFIRGLLEKTPTKRLGCNGIHEIVSNEWFDGFDWNKMRQRKIEPPYVPNISNLEDVSHFDTYPDENIVEELNGVSAYEWCDVF
eukprot:342206_1